ncbi:MAG: DNA mismatch repair endonuclease MutL [Lachnospiraceae bacterium]|nr:DNA mismatch repair endonuclease MutL [Lachnospiraceae bacterium]
MPEIHVLDNGTIDKIAAGEVVERPASVVKELVENAIDAGATAITVDIKQGGIAFMRITDNGYGIPKDQIRKAFLRHATSKIYNVEDLLSCSSLGFRGEALSSIAAVSMVELATKQKDALMGVRYVLEGTEEKEMEDIGVPDGTTIIVRNIFFNTPARRKFLKTPQTEASYISELMEHLAMSKPDISFKYVINGQLKFHTSGNGDLKEIIYRIYGRDITKELLPIHYGKNGITISGYIGKPTINRSNRNFENFFVNHRYIKSDIIGKSVEGAYKPFLMQHKFPFAILHFELHPDTIDINVHPTKMEIRFSNPNELYQIIQNIVSESLSMQELIPEVTIEIPGNRSSGKSVEKLSQDFSDNRVIPILDEVRDIRTDTDGISASNSNISDSCTSELGPADIHKKEEANTIQSTINYEKKKAPEPFEVKRQQVEAPCVREESFYTTAQIKSEEDQKAEVQSKIFSTFQNTIIATPQSPVSNVIKSKDHILVEKATQLDFFDDKLLTKEARSYYKILGQIFDTYWLIAFSDKLFIMDQHAAHEKVKYESLIKRLREKDIVSQQVNPPVIITLSSREEAVLKTYITYFTELGFEIEEFGGNEYALRSVPTDLYGRNEKELFEEILSELEENNISRNPQVIEEKIASMSCKAAVKGNNTLSVEEAGALLDQLLELDNPYHCPHGRPTIISMSKYEIEKKFKRIL